MNIQESTIQVELTFRNLCRMHLQQLTNFPYIEKDFDALTDYELLCLVVKYLNDVISNQNEQNASITRMYQAFLSLQDYINEQVGILEDEWNNKTQELETAFNNLNEYVQNYFANLDVQDEIDHKLDEYLEDGTLENIIDKYLNTLVIDVKNYGAKGDGETDDTTSIQNAINGATTNNIKTIIFPTGSYVVTAPLTISQSNLILKGLSDAELKYVGDGTTGNIIEISGTDADDYVENITIDGLKIDGTNQLYKGGYSMDTPAVTHTNPCYRGLVCISINYGKNIKISNNIINDVYGDGIKVSRCTDVLVTNNKLYDVSSGNIQYDGQTGYDNHGDGIVAFFSYNVKFENNTLVNKRKYLDGITAAIGKPCGRSGLEFEYSINGDYSDDNPNDPVHNAPDYDLVPTILDDNKNYRYGFGLIMDNNYVYGYTKGIHAENRVKTILKNNVLVFNHISIMTSTSNQQIISGNYVNPFNVGVAPQSGYDLYYGSITVSQFSAGPTRYGTIINNNVFEGDGRGCVVACDNTTITNNTFRSKQNVYFLVANLNNIVVSNNTFNNTGVTDFASFFLIYNVRGCVLSNNTFYSTAPCMNDISGNNITISDNYFFNTSLNNNNGGDTIAVKNNIFRGDSFSNVLLTLYNAKNCLVDNNTFRCENSEDNTNYIMRINGTNENCVIQNNKFYTNTSRTQVIFRNENTNYAKIINNSLFGNGVVDFIQIYNAINCVITDNFVENTNGSYLKVTGSFQKLNVVERNVGKLTVSGYKPNDGVGRFDDTYFDLSQKVYKYNINNSSPNIGWICVSAGWYATTTWATDTSYNANKLLKNSSDNIYRCITKGSGNSTVEPTHTTATDVTESDGYVWRYLGAIAVLKDLPL